MFQIYLGPFPFHVGLHRISGIDLIAFNIAGYPRLSCKNSVITDGDMARASYLSGKDAVIACFRTAGNPYLGDNEAIFPDFHIMAEMNEIIDFCSPFDNGTVPLSMQVQAPISTSSPIFTLPIWGIRV